MKRSEILKIVEQAILDSDWQGYYDDYYIDIAAKAALDAIEKAGMLPPFIDKSTQDGDYISLHVSQVVYNGNCEWEPEK